MVKGHEHRLLALIVLALIVRTGRGLVTDRAPEEEVVVTVRGAISPAAMGKALVHEHVLCDFIGAEKTGPERWRRSEVVEVMRPHLQALKERGVTTFIDCTPAYIGRDPELLRQLSETTGLHVLTNTGYYGAAGDKFLPPHARKETAAELAARWIEESRRGIGETGIRPGFIKIGVDPGPLDDMDRKLVEAAARTHLATGLTMACHTGEARAAAGVLETVQAEGVDPAALVVVHADGIADAEARARLARAGAWVEYDGVRAGEAEKHVRLVKDMVERGLAGRLLLSHDAGWYAAGEAGGAKEKIRPFTAITDELLPALRKAGLEEALLEKLLVENPRQAFTIRVRKAR